MKQPAFSNTKKDMQKRIAERGTQTAEGVKNDFGGEEWALGQSLDAMVSCDVTVRHTSIHISA